MKQLITNSINRKTKPIFRLLQWDLYTTGCWLNYNYFKEYYAMIAIDLTKQQDANPKAMQPTNLAENLDREWNADPKMFFIIKEEKKFHFRFFTRKCKTILILFFSLV